MPIIWTNKKQSTKGLKKSDTNEWYDSQNKIFYRKVNGRLQAFEESTDKRYYQQLLQHLRRNNKSGVLDGYINDLKEAHSELLKEMKKFNTGESKTNIQLNNASKRFNLLYNDVMKTTSSSKIKKTVETRMMVKVLRMRHTTNITEENVMDVLDKLLDEFSESLQISRAYAKDLILPVGFEESSKYEDLSDILINQEPNMEDVIASKERDGTIDSFTASHLRQLYRGMIDSLFSKGSI